MSSDDGHRRLSSTPETPRKRRRLGSVLDPAQIRKHDVLRRHDIEASYNDAYRLLFNEHVTQAASRFHVGASVQHYSKQVGSVRWSATEQAVFFAALERLGRDDIAGIAKAISTKTAAETRDFLVLLHDAAAAQGDAKLTLRDIPAAVDIGRACGEQLDRAGDALAWYQERLEASQEQERYGDYWLITPPIAEDIEAAINGMSRSRPASEVLEARPKKSGFGIVGACASCKRRKKKCDREIPCANCASSGIDCVYPENPPNTIKSDPAPPTTSNSDYAMVNNTAGTEILQAIPQATLLHPEMMLTLSKHLFMNRSGDFPSPWPHWSHYTSELAEEPSIYRTAFNDFHSLVVSLTKRLVQTSIIQTTSRLRAQRPRNKKGSLPMVRPRDVYTAIDTLGLKRNGSDRWRGVPRRCGLRVTTTKLTPQGKYLREVREVPWDEVERLLSSTTATEAESSAEPEGFKSRAARGGTPLPMHNLTISDSDDDDDVVQRADITDNDDSDYYEPLNDDGPRAATHHASQSVDLVGRSESVPLDSAAHEPVHRFNTLEDFDCEASRLEESALRATLGMQEAAKSDSEDVSGRLKDKYIDMDEKVTTTADGWRQHQEYRAPWETYKTPVSVLELLANQKPSSPMPVVYGSRLRNTGSTSGDFSDPSSTIYFRRKQHKSNTEVELHARGTNAYAALRRDNLEGSNVEVEATDTETASVSVGEDTIAQSIEPEGDTVRIDEYEDEMDWT